MLHLAERLDRKHVLVTVDDTRHNVGDGKAGTKGGGGLALTTPLEQDPHEGAIEEQEHVAGAGATLQQHLDHGVLLTAGPSGEVLDEGREESRTGAEGFVV